MTQTRLFQDLEQTLSLPSVLIKIIYDYFFLTLKEFRSLLSSGQTDYSNIPFEEGCDFTDLDLPNLNFTSAYLPQAIFGSSDRYSYLQINFMHASLERATFKNLYLLGTCFDEANLTDALFYECRLSNVVWDVEGIEKSKPATFHGAILEETTFFNTAWHSNFNNLDLDIFSHSLVKENNCQLQTSKGKNIAWIWSPPPENIFNEYPLIEKTRLASTQKIKSILASDKLKSHFVVKPKKIKKNSSPILLEDMDNTKNRDRLGTNHLFSKKRKNEDVGENELIFNKNKKNKYKGNY